MSQIMKAFTGLFMVLIMGTAAGGILSMFLSVTQAQNLQASVKYRISCSAFAPAVMEECFADAETMSQKLTLTLYREDGSSQTIAAAGAVPSDCSTVVGAKVSLTFALDTAIPQTHTQHTLTGYVR